MTAQTTQHVSVIDPIAPAIETVKQVLFKPFDLARWFTIGFCAWLAFLGRGGGFNFNFSYRTGRSPAQVCGQARDFAVANLYWLIPTAVTVFILMVVLGLLILWLSSRGRFMFLHCVALNKAEVKLPWRKFRDHANSLFLFRLVVGIIFFLTFIISGGLITLLLIVSKSDLAHFRLGAITGVTLASLLAFCLMICFIILYGFTNEFVVPIMFLRTSSTLDAWRQFLPLLSANKGRFALYVLFRIVIILAITAIIAAAACVTCCCAACLFSIPYIGTVLMLPIFVFKRSYSLHYLRQYGREFDLFISG